MPSAFSFPTSDTPLECALVVVPIPVLPFILGAMGQLQERQYWQTADDWYAAYEAIAAVEVCAMATCVNELIESNNRMYRMLDTALFGVGYTVESTDPLVVTPPIPPQRTMGIYGDDSILGRMENLKQLLENALNGTDTPQYDRANGVRDLIQQLINAIGNEQTDLDGMLTKLELIATLVA